jgi:hypothetical protein
MSGLLSRDELLALPGVDVLDTEEAAILGRTYYWAGQRLLHCDFQWVRLFGGKDLPLVIDENRILGWQLRAELNWRSRRGLL